MQNVCHKYACQILKFIFKIFLSQNEMKKDFNINYRIILNRNVLKITIKKSVSMKISNLEVECWRDPIDSSLSISLLPYEFKM